MFAACQLHYSGGMFVRPFALICTVALLGGTAGAQEPPDPHHHHPPPTQPQPQPPPEPGPQPHQHPPSEPHEHPAGLMLGDWHVMQDGMVFLTFNHQGGPRGDTEFKSQNWWMGMFSRPAGAGQLTLSGMLSLDPLTVGNEGYAQLFQAGETYQGRPLIDRQHPHDFLMQLAAIWRVPLSDRLHLTLAGAPVGEPALGPVAFMHRRSSAENPTAPLGHHSFDSTHIAMGVITAALDSGPWMIESSVFHGAEPDENRWDLMDPGPLDSIAVRGWYHYGETWTFQASHGFLKDPEAFDPGDVRRTTVSASWEAERGRDFTAATIALGRNTKHGAGYNALIAEGTQRRGLHSFYGRLEALHVESELLQTGHPHHSDDHAPSRDVVIALTLGAVREVWSWNGVDLGIGGDLTFYGVPDALAPTHGSRPVSFHVFGRLRPPARWGRMWGQVMTTGMRH
jgi:hypothetical protein